MKTYKIHIPLAIHDMRVEPPFLPNDDFLRMSRRGAIVLRDEEYFPALRLLVAELKTVFPGLAHSYPPMKLPIHKLIHRRPGTPRRTAFGPTVLAVDSLLLRKMEPEVIADALIDCGWEISLTDQCGPFVYRCEWYKINDFEVTYEVEESDKPVRFTPRIYKHDPKSPTTRIYLTKEVE